MQNEAKELGTNGAESGRVDRLVMRNAAIKKIRTQFGDTPEHKLMFAILEQAIKDLFVPRERASALRYLNGDMLSAELCGVEPDWARMVLKKCGMVLSA